MKIMAIAPTNCNNPSKANSKNNQPAFGMKLAFDAGKNLEVFRKFGIKDEETVKIFEILKKEMSNINKSIDSIFENGLKKYFDPKRWFKEMDLPFEAIQKALGKEEISAKDVIPNYKDGVINLDFKKRIEGGGSSWEFLEPELSHTMDDKTITNVPCRGEVFSGPIEMEHHLKDRLCSHLNDSIIKLYDNSPILKEIFSNNEALKVKTNEVVAKQEEITTKNKIAQLTEDFKLV